MRGIVESSVADTMDMTNVTGSVLFRKVQKPRTSSCTSYVSATSFSKLEMHQPNTLVSEQDKGNFIDYSKSKESQCL